MNIRPRGTHRPSLMGQLVHFVFGDLIRFLVLFAIAFVVFAAIEPDIARIAVTNVIDVILGPVIPIIWPLFALLAVVAGFKMIFTGKPPFSKKTLPKKGKPNGH